MSKIEICDLDHLRELTRERSISFHGDVFLDHKRAGEYLAFEEYQGSNIIPTEGLNSILDTSIGGATQLTGWYVGIFKGNYTPIATNTAANSLGVAGLFTECQDADYDPATNRPAFTIVAASGGVITNAAAKAEFDMKASITVYGAFVASSQAKTATTGKLLAAKKFDASRSVIATDILYVTYQISAISS
jgi:hypothetical protein